MPEYETATSRSYATDWASAQSVVHAGVRTGQYVAELCPNGSENRRTVPRLGWFLALSVTSSTSARPPW